MRGQPSHEGHSVLHRNSSERSVEKVFQTNLVLCLFYFRIISCKFYSQVIDGLNVKEVVNRIVLHRDLFNQGLWSLYLNFRFRLRASHFFVSGSGSRTIWSKKQEKHLYYLYNSLELEPKFPAPPSKSFWLPLHSPGSNTSFIIATASQHSLAIVTQPEV